LRIVFVITAIHIIIYHHLCQNLMIPYQKFRRFDTNQEK